ncbi:MAG: lectin-like protein [Verrucomicrobia bacterium]|nr:lectin-like protein [Verrucomicrobiota bacterium]
MAQRYDSIPDGSDIDMGFRLARSSGSVSGTGFVVTSNVVVDIRAKVTISTTAEHGTVTGAGDYTPGSTATLTATAAPGYVFTTWSGDASGTTNPLSLVMDSAKTVTAKFAPDTTDGDGDGLSACLEAVVYGTDPALSDTDGDGLTDGWEIGLGRFSTIAGSFTWAQAHADAHARGGELACFPTADRWNRAMESLGANALDSYTGLWIGASDATTEGTWTWVNGEPFSFTQWATSRPSTTPGNTLDDVEVSGGGGAEIGKWYDRSATTIRDGYILETGYATDPLVADADGDGLNDGAEQAAGSNPFMADTDGDGLTDAQEVNLTHTNPKLADSNGNGTSDAQEDPDGDGLTNLAEVTQYGTDPLNADTDGDGVNDGAEIYYAGSFYQLVPGSFTYPQAVADAATKRGRVASFPNATDYSRMAAKARQMTQGYLWLGLSDAASEGTWLWSNGTTATYNRWLTGQPNGGATENQVVIMENSMQWADAAEDFVTAGYIFERVGLDPLAADTDADGLTDGQELTTTHTSPVLDDTDGDGLLDGAEVNTYHSNPLLVDTDGDGLSDRIEVEVYHTNPSLKDSDGDGFDDLFEVNTGFDPALASSTPDALSTIRTAVEFRFNAATGVSYRIEASTDFDQWDTIETDIIGQSAVVTRFYSTENMPQRYFRVRRN